MEEWCDISEDCCPSHEGYLKHPPSKGEIYEKEVSPRPRRNRKGNWELQIFHENACTRAVGKNSMECSWLHPWRRNGWHHIEEGLQAGKIGGATTCAVKIRPPPFTNWPFWGAPLSRHHFNSLFICSYMGFKINFTPKTQVERPFTYPERQWGICPRGRWWSSWWARWRGSGTGPGPSPRGSAPGSARSRSPGCRGPSCSRHWKSQYVIQDTVGWQNDNEHCGLPEFWQMVEECEQVAHDDENGPRPRSDHIAHLHYELVLRLQLWKNRWIVVVVVIL